MLFRSLEIKNPPEGKEEYLGWYIIIYVHDVRGHDFVVRGIEDMTPDVYIKMSKEKPKDVSDINDLTFACSAKNRNTGVGRFRNTFVETSDRKLPKYLEYLGTCTEFNYPENETIIEPFTSLLTWYDFEKDTIRYYENELERQDIVEQLKRNQAD